VIKNKCSTRPRMTLLEYILTHFFKSSFRILS
jgi:hypothetical protein